MYDLKNSRPQEDSEEIRIKVMQWAYAPDQREEYRVQGKTSLARKR